MKGAKWSQDVLDKVKQLHAEGKCDHDIWLLMPGVFFEDRRGRQQVNHIRRTLLDLPTNVDKQHGRRSTDSRIAAGGLTGIVEALVVLKRRYAEAHGWPGDTRPRSVQILDALYALGPRTRRQLAVDLDLPCARRGQLDRKSLNKAFNSNPGSYFSQLIKVGLVCEFGRISSEGSVGRSQQMLYALTGYAISLKETFLERTHKTNTRGQAPS